MKIFRHKAMPASGENEKTYIIRYNLTIGGRLYEDRHTYCNSKKELFIVLKSLKNDKEHISKISVYSFK